MSYGGTEAERKYHREWARKRRAALPKKIDRRVTHGHARDRRNRGIPPEYVAWHAMHKRCADLGNARYGGRGIKVCDRWIDFENFIADVGPRPSPQHSLDRFPDNDGNYEPGNVRWATAREQAQNTSKNHLLVLDGRTLCLTAWAREAGLSPQLLRWRMERLGMSLRAAMVAPKRWSK